MGDIELVHVVDTGPPRWLQDQRRTRGLDPMTGRRPDGQPTPLVGALITLAVLAGIGLFFWFCLSLAWTLATS